MRKRIVILSLAAVLLLSSCGSSSSSTTASSVASEPTASSDAESEPASETIVEEVVEEEPEPREGNFRVGFWGDDIETIKKYEIAELIEEENNALVYDNLKVSNYDAYGGYFFDEQGALYQGVYKLTEEYRNGNTYISTYNLLKETLTSIYGEPVVDGKNVYKDAANYTDEGTALEYGLTSYAAVWDTEETEIILSLGADDSDLCIALLYFDIDHDIVRDTTGL